MPYRIDIPRPPHDALDRLVHLGALDFEWVNDGLAAILPDAVSPDAVAAALRVEHMTVSPALSRDDGSVWLLNPGIFRLGSIVVAPPDVAAPAGALRLTDSTAFGTGHHPTTALCVEALEEAIPILNPERLLDVGTGSGVLALAALRMGVPQALGVDIDAGALRVAAQHARLNNMEDRLHLLLGGPEVADGRWPLVVANILAAPLIEMAPLLVRRVGHRGRLILSGIPQSVVSEVALSYQRLGMRNIRSETRGGWTMLVAEGAW
jgi:ribosomal protein L11 methyltransferase